MSGYIISGNDLNANGQWEEFDLDSENNGNGVQLGTISSSAAPHGQATDWVIILVSQGGFQIQSVSKGTYISRDGGDDNPDVVDLGPIGSANTFTSSPSLPNTGIPKAGTEYNLIGENGKYLTMEEGYVSYQTAADPNNNNQKKRQSWKFSASKTVGDEEKKDN